MDLKSQTTKRTCVLSAQLHPEVTLNTEELKPQTSLFVEESHYTIPGISQHPPANHNGVHTNTILLKEMIVRVRTGSFRFRNEDFRISLC